ncbi:MAG: DUF3089 domain-containing protein [Parvularculaceae bacterium]
MNWRRAIWAGAAAASALAIAGVVVFQDNITRYFANPKIPFQVVSPPLAPDYGERGAWALRPDEASAGAADVFYIHSTTFYSSEGWNASINDGEAVEALRKIAIPNEAGPFIGAGPLYAPRYRQSTLFASFTQKFDGVAARSLAYRDVKRAFDEFLLSVEEGRPIILVGYGQGGLYVQGLLQDYFQTDEPLRRRLAVAYVIGQTTPMSLFDSTLAKTPPCHSPADIRCVNSYTDLEQQFDEEMERARRRSMVWSRGGDLVAISGEDILCVNPLTWTTATDYVGPEAHLGAASATGLRFGDTPPAIAKAIGARCSNGVLLVDRPAQEFLRRGNWFGAKWRAQAFNLFYYDLAGDAERRVRNLMIRQDHEYRLLDPIEESVDLDVSPVNKVPNP